ncbi:MAG: hypothetical protein PHX40_04105 [Bacilli bacterium]|nr:hypothetical protein [Bacilli bacterium]
MLYITVDGETTKFACVGDCIKYAREQAKENKTVSVINRLDDKDTVINFNDKKFDNDVKFAGMSFEEMRKQVKSEMTTYAKKQGITMNQLENQISKVEHRKNKTNGILVKTK